MENFNTVPDKGTFGGSVEVINQNFSLAQQEMETLRQMYSSLSQSKPIPVTQLPATGEAGKIYRLAGTTSYADYMYSENDLTTPIKMAEYDNAIDDKPTFESDNLVKSGGVYKDIFACKNSERWETAYKWLNLMSIDKLAEGLNGGTVNTENNSITLNVGQQNRSTYMAINLIPADHEKYIFRNKGYFCMAKISKNTNIDIPVNSSAESDGHVRLYFQLQNNSSETWTAIPTDVAKIDENYYARAYIPAGDYSQVRIVEQVVGNISVSVQITFTITDIRVELQPLHISFDELIEGFEIDFNNRTSSLISQLVEFEDIIGYKFIVKLIVREVVGDATNLNVYFSTKTNSIEPNLLINITDKTGEKELTIDSNILKDITNISTTAVSGVTSWSGRLILKVKKDNTFNINDVRAFPKSYKLITRAMQNATKGLLKSDGTIAVLSDNYFTSDFIKVNKWTRLYGYGVFPKGQSWNGICLYDANKNFIAGLSYNNQGGLNSVIDSDTRIIDTGLQAFPNVQYIRFSSFATDDNYKTALYICTPNDDVIDYTSEDIFYASILGFPGMSGSIAANNLANYRTPLIRVKPGQIWVFTGNYYNYQTFPAVVGYSDMDLSNPVALVTANGKLHDFVFKIPNGVKYIVGWSSRGDDGIIHQANVNINEVCYLKRKKDNIVVRVNKNGGTTVSSTSLLEGILMATEGYDNTVIVEDGTYNLISEFESYYGSTFFTNYDNSVKGIYLKNRVNVIFSSGAEVICHYTGNNTNVQQEFSPFNADAYGFTVNNLHLRCSRVRYCVHDERGLSTDSYENTYLNCDMQIDNTNNSVWHSSNTIGGGLGKYGNIKVLNSIFETIDPQVYSNFGTVSWHNCRLADAKSRIVISGNYLKGSTGRIRISWYGESTLITTALITNNSMGGSIVHRAEVPKFDIHNTEIIEWNNIIRQ